MRTEQGPAERHSNGKYSATFRTFRGTPGNEYVAFESGSAALFDSEDEAYAAGERALAVLEATGAFPNMCEPF